MSPRETPAWLNELQERFGATIRTPLDRSTGTLRAVTASYPARTDTLPTTTRTAEERLAVYNRQYWFRLFGVVQSEFPLSARLVGFWHFNALAALFLRQHPPRGFDIGAAADGFAAWLHEEAPAPSLPLPAEMGLGGGVLPLPREALLEAATLDERWRRLFHAPEQPSFRPSAADAARLMQGRLQPTGSWALHRECWPLVELRQALVTTPLEHERPVPLPAPLSSPQDWLLLHRAEGTARLPLAPQQARLLELLCTNPVGVALASLEDECPQQERAALPARVQRWLAHSVELELWSRLESAPSSR